MKTTKVIGIALVIIALIAILGILFLRHKQNNCDDYGNCINHYGDQSVTFSEGMPQSVYPPSFVLSGNNKTISIDYETLLDYTNPKSQEVAISAAKQIFGNENNNYNYTATFMKSGAWEVKIDTTNCHPPVNSLIHCVGGGVVIYPEQKIYSFETD